MRIPFVKKISGVFNRFVDNKFQNYRGQISNKVAHGGAFLTAFIVLWTLFLLFLFFGGIAAGFSLAYLTGSRVIGFSIVTTIAFLIGFITFLYRNEIIVQPIFIALNKAMDGEDPEEILEPPKKLKKANKEAQIEELKEKIKEKAS